MWKSERLSKLQVSGTVPRGMLGDIVETNIRLITGEAANCVTCRRVAVESAIWSGDLLQTVCSILRRRDRLIAVPSPSEESEILMVGSSEVACRAVQRDGWHADLRDMGKGLELRFTNERELTVIGDLIEKALVLGFESDGSHWRLGSSARYWHSQQPAKSMDGIQAVPRVSFATLAPASAAIGIAFDSGFLYQTEQSIAYFFDSRVDPHERDKRMRQFDRLSLRTAGFKGTLLYDTGSNEHHVCYFERFARGQTLATTRHIEGYSSLYEYCLNRHRCGGYQPDDSVAYVSFKGLPQVVPVPAKRLRLRVPLSREQMPKELRESTSTAPGLRRSTIVNLWDRCNRSILKQTNLRVQNRLWRPVASDHELLACPELVFGKGRRVTPPAKPTIEEYRRYYWARMDTLRNGGVFRFESSTRRDIHLVTPVGSSGWPDALQKTFVRDFTQSISDFVGQTFSIHEVRADAVTTIVERLEDAGADRLQSGRSAVVVFDDKLRDPAPYCLLSHRLVRWNLKRVRRHTIEKKWQSCQEAWGREAQHRADQRWKNMIELTVLDTLLQMDATPWRLCESPADLREPSYGYDACVAIDVGEGRRYFAMSLLICRASSDCPSYLRVTKAWPKGDSDREEINPVQLQEKMAWMFEQYAGSSFSPLQSLLVLRDGRVCGQESQAIDKTIDHLHKMDKLYQSARVDVVDVHKRTVKGLRMWYPIRDLFSNILEGQAVYLAGRRALVSCTGAATLPPTVTAEPCLLHAHGDADIRRVARGFFSFAQLNYSTPNKAHRCALPIHLTDEELRQKLAQDMRGIK